MRLITLSALFAFFILGSCKKLDTPDPTPFPPAGNTKDIFLLTTSATPGELVLAQANFTLEKDTASITVGDKVVIAVKLDSNRIAFVMPLLPSSTSAIIRYDKMGLAKQLSISVSSYTPIAQPDVVYNQFIKELDETQQLFATYEIDTIISLDPKYRQMLQYVRQNFAIKYASFTTEQKTEVAYSLRFNMISDQDYKVDFENLLFFARPQADPGDAGDACKRVIGKILGRSGSAGIKMLRGGALGATGSVMITLGVDPFTKGAGVILAGAGVALFVQGANEYIEAHAYDQMLNNMFSLRDLGFESQRITSAPIVLVKDVETPVIFKGTFRTIIQSDAASPNLLAKEGFVVKTKLGELKAIAEKAYSQIKLFLLGNGSQLPATIPQFGTTSLSKMLVMQGAKLSISNVSNSAITVAYIKEEGSLKIKATSTTLTIQTPFTFDLTYSNSNTGTTITDKIDAVYKAFSYKVGFLDGTPVGTAQLTFSKDVSRFFTLLNDDGTTATGINYSQVSINGITNPNVTVTANNVAGSSFSIRLNTPLTTSQTTSFNVLYQSQKVQTINAMVDDSTEYYKSLVPGVWFNTWDYDFNNNGNFSFYEEDKIICSAGGSALWTEARYYTGVVQPMSISLSWSVYRSGSIYIMQLGAQTGRITPNLSFFNTPANRLKLHTHKN